MPNRYHVDTSTVMLEYERTDLNIPGKLKELCINKMSIYQFFAVSKSCSTLLCGNFNHCWKNCISVVFSNVSRLLICKDIC